MTYFSGNRRFITTIQMSNILYNLLALFIFYIFGGIAGCKGSADVQVKDEALEKLRLNRALVNAVKTEEKTRIISLINEGADVNYIEPLNSSLDINENDPSLKVDEGDCPLCLATQKRMPEIMRILIEKGARINQPCCYSKQTPLHAAADNCFEDGVLLLLEKSANPNSFDNDGNTPLHLISKRLCNGSSFIKIAKILIEKGADPFAVDGEGKTMIEIRDRSFEDADVRAFINSLYKDLFDAVEKGKLSLFKKRYDPKLHKTAKNNAGIPLMHMASIKGRLDIIEYLVECGHDVNTVDALLQDTPLFKAAEYGNMRIVKYLSEHGADIDHVGRYNRSPIRAAARRGNLEIARYLLEKGAKLDCETTREESLFKPKLGRDKIYLDTSVGSTPLHDAAVGGNVQIAELFCNKGCCPVNAKDSGGRTPLHLAVKEKNRDMVKYLIEKRGARTDIKDNDNKTPFDKAE